MNVFSLFRTPAGGRTLDTLIKSQVLYQLSYKRKKIFGCTPAGGRTLDTLIKSQVLYQLSYKRVLFFFAVAKVRTLFDSAKFF